MKATDIILIVQSEAIEYEKYSKLPIERLELYRNLIYPRMVYFKGGFRSHLDLISYFQHGQFFADADYAERRNLTSIWNLPGLISTHLTRVLMAHGITAQIINNFDAEWDVFCQTYEKNTQPPLISISTTFYLGYPQIGRIIKKIRKKYPQAEIVCGGAFLNEQAVNSGLASFERPMRKYGINYILHAFNSERDLVYLIKGRMNGSYQDVNNMAYILGEDLKSGPFRTTEQKWHKAVLDHEGIALDQTNFSWATHTVQTRLSCGCPFSCAFCSYPTTAREYSTLDSSAVAKELQSILSVPQIKNIIFIDDTLNVPLKRFKELCRVFCQFDFKWFSFLRVQYLDEESARLIKESGCKAVYLGIESANDGILQNMNKKATRHEFEQGIALLKKNDITSLAAFIIGFPGETEQTIEENINFIENTGIDFYTLKEFYFMKHTGVYAQKERYGLTGLGNDWQHDTMDYQTASDKKIEMFRRIKKSIYIDADTNLWHIACLYDKGFSINTIKAMQTQINKIMLDQLDGKRDDQHTAFKNLKEIILQQ